MPFHLKQLFRKQTLSLWANTLLLWCTILIGPVNRIQAQTQPDSVLYEQLSQYFDTYTVEGYSPLHKSQLTKLYVDDTLKAIYIYGNNSFGSQPFTTEVVNSIKQNVSDIIPDKYKEYAIHIYDDQGHSIEELIPNIYRLAPDANRLWTNLNYKREPWIKNLSRPFSITNGLQNRHLTIWASHGRYYDNDKEKWVWQRPYLYCTTEDLFTQTIVVPFLLPMLENAGAIVYTPRERDWQSNEVIVDNDTPQKDGTYSEEGTLWNNTFFPGFAHLKEYYQDSDNPFLDGTARSVKASANATQSCRWAPKLPQDGEYAVYICYQTFLNSITDAHYTVVHKGIHTTFNINQQMGGGVWVYLGTFDFSSNDPINNCVILSNLSKESGIVTADAIRFGGGMGNISRNSECDTATTCYDNTSNLPRYLEGARYSVQWSGFPYRVYSSKQGINDYGDDINARSYSMNYLSGGSIFLPDTIGLKVPIELSLAVHSDAGYKINDDGYGTLGICTTTGNDNRIKYINGKSRWASYDFAHFLTDQVSKEIHDKFGYNWKRRELYNRNYSETRNPEVPSAILEVLAHQNFTDMRLGHDPHFKFSIARSIYKAILKYTAFSHQTSYTVQPLPIRNFGMKLSNRKTLNLFWEDVPDSAESTAKPTAYIVYTAVGEQGFDNGTIVSSNHYSLTLKQGITYKFKVSAINDGGESFPSETLVAHIKEGKVPSVLIVNAFDRLSGPAYIQTADSLGFLLDQDPGVPYIKTPEYCGKQVQFNRRDIGKSGPQGLGYSSNEREGLMLLGNSFNYPALHAQAFEDYPCTILSVSRGALEQGKVNLNDFDLVDVIFGLQKESECDLVKSKTFTPTLQHKLSSFLHSKGNLLISGAYIASDMKGQPDYINKELHYNYAGNIHQITNDTIFSPYSSFTLSCNWGEEPYTVHTLDCLTPLNGAQTLFSYYNGKSAAIQYADKRNRIVALGFPLECIRNVSTRKKISQHILNFLLPTK